MRTKRVRHHVNPLADTTEHRFAGFDNTRPIIVDIGADRGEFTAGLVARWGAAKNIVVCEIRRPLARRLEERFAAFPNVRVFDGDAARNLRGLLEPSIRRSVSVEEIYINFPDPWLKKRHHKRRVVTETFLRDARTWMPRDTWWIFQTDQPVLFDETVEVLRRCAITATMFYAPPYGITTKWEDAKVAAGAPIYRCRFHM